MLTAEHSRDPGAVRELGDPSLQARHGDNDVIEFHVACTRRSLRLQHPCGAEAREEQKLAASKEAHPALLPAREGMRTNCIRSTRAFLQQ
jgi:hypothetical protein